MKKIFVAMLAAMGAIFVASPAMAQATRTWVSGVGDDANPCSRTAPCKTFAGAISKTAVNGEINCLDSAGYGSVTINKAITISCNGVTGGVIVSGTEGVVIDAPADARIILDGLDIQSIPNNTQNGYVGISIRSARDVEITNTTVRNFSYVGVSVRSPTQIRVTIDHVKLFGNAIGVMVDPPSSGPNSAKISNTLIATSTAAGIRLSNSLASGYISDVVIVGTPQSLQLFGGAVMNSYGNNVLNGAATDAPTPTPLQ